jgi:hypothetical protein
MNIPTGNSTHANPNLHSPSRSTETARSRARHTLHMAQPEFISMVYRDTLESDYIPCSIVCRALRGGWAYWCYYLGSSGAKYY